MPEGVSPVDPVVFAVGVAGWISVALSVAARRPEWVVRWPRSVLGMLLLVTLAATGSLIRFDPIGLQLTIDPSTEPLLPTGDPDIDVYRRSVLDFGDDQVFVIAMVCDDVFQAENLEAMRRVSDAISRINGVTVVKSLVKVTSFRYVPEEDWLEVRPFIEDIPEDPAVLARLRERALSDPMYRRNLISDDGRTAALNVSFRPMTDLEFIAADIDGQILSVLDQETTADRRFHVSGRPHIKSVMYRAMTRDLLVLIPVALLVLTSVLVPR